MIYYVDLVLGSDATGDGSAALPFKTINKAANMVSGPHDVRVAKTTAPTTIGAGTILTWTSGSGIIQTSASLIGTVVIGDHIGRLTAAGNGSKETFYRVVGITTNTITVVGKYYGTTGTSNGCLKQTAIASTTTTIATLSVSGTSVSGGWDLVALVQNGETWMMASVSWATATGKGFAITANNITISKINLLEIYRGATMAGLNYSFANLTFLTNYYYLDGVALNTNGSVTDCCMISYIQSMTFYINAGLITVLTNNLFIGYTIFTITSGSEPITSANFVLINNIMYRSNYTLATDASCLTLGLSSSNIVFNGDIIKYFDSAFIINTDNCSINNAIVSNCVSNGVKFSAVNGLLINNCDFLDAPVGVNGGTDNNGGIVILDSSFTNCIDAAITNRFFGLRIENTSFINCRYGVEVDQYSHHITIAGCTFLNPTIYGVSKELLTGCIEIADCTIDAPSAARARNNITGINNVYPAYILKNAFNEQDGLCYTFGCFQKDIIFHSSAPSMAFHYDAPTTNNNISDIKVVSTYAPAAIAKTFSLYVMAGLSWVGTMTPKWKLNGHTIKTEADVSAITAGWVQYTWTCAAGLITVDGLLSLEFNFNCNATPVYFDDIVIS